MSPQTVWLMMKWFRLLSEGKIDTRAVEISGLAYAVVDSVVREKGWEEVAREFRLRNGVEVGTGYGKESE